MSLIHQILDAIWSLIRLPFFIFLFLFLLSAFMLLSCLIPVPILLAVIAAVALMVYKIKSILEIRESEKAAAEQKRLDNIQREKLLPVYGWKTKNEIAHICGMPDDTFIDEYGLPRQHGTSIETDKYIRFISNTGHAFHRSPTCTRGAIYPCHVLNLGPLSPCAKCFPDFPPNMNWFYEYKITMCEIHRYNVPLADESPDTPPK